MVIVELVFHWPPTFSVRYLNAESAINPLNLKFQNTQLLCYMALKVTSLASEFYFHSQEV